MLKVTQNINGFPRTFCAGVFLMAEKMGNYLEERYNEIFEQVCSFIIKKKTEDVSFTKEDLESLLKVQYLYLDQDIEGRGIVGDVPIQATIAAYEHCLAEWK